MLAEIFGNYPKVKVIDYLLAHPFYSYNKQQIAVGSEISRITLNKFIDDLIRQELIIKEGSQYRINSKSEIVQLLDKIQNELAMKEMKEQAKIFDEKIINYTDEKIDNMFPTDIPDIDLNEAEREIEDIENDENPKQKSDIQKAIKNLNKRITNIESKYKN